MPVPYREGAKGIGLGVVSGTAMGWQRLENGGGARKLVMLIGIIETGRPPDDLKQRHGSYPDMFKRLLAKEDATLRFQSFAALDGEVPSDPHTCDAWLITGSRHGVYDNLPWMAPLAQFIRDAVGESVPVVGICFGHQIVAEALGGKVVQSDRGWGVGIHDYDIGSRPVWMKDAPDSFAVNAVHQDQISDLPHSAEVVASSPFCPHAVLAYGDKAFTIQAHPEFDNAFKHDLIESRLTGLVPEQQLSEARSSLARDPNSSLVAKWIVQYLQHAVSEASVAPAP